MWLDGPTMNGLEASVRPEPVEGFGQRYGWFGKLTTNGTLVP